MSGIRFISRELLETLVAGLVESGREVLAPVSEAPATGGKDPASASPGNAAVRRTRYRRISSLGEARLGGPLPRLPLKEVLWPPTEPLLRYRQRQGEVEVEQIPPGFIPRVVIGAPPCDAAALEVLDRVMGWDWRDETWFGRREATTVVSLACAEPDGSCFCRAVGLGPDSGRGADVLLTPVQGGYLAEILTTKGEELLGPVAASPAEPAGGGAPEPLAEEGRRLREAARRKVEGNLAADPRAIGSWLEGHFDDPFWKRAALACHGCGTCAFVCPACHCFDIVDEAQGIDRGTRRRNWDTCQANLFTLHASGHNPRPDQNTRIRQRLMHKFFIYPRRFGEILCTGCGRCARACPGGMDILELLGLLDGLAREAVGEGRSAG